MARNLFLRMGTAAEARVPPKREYRRGVQIDSRVSHPVNGNGHGLRRPLSVDNLYTYEIFNNIDLFGLLMAAGDRIDKYLSRIERQLQCSEDTPEALQLRMKHLESLADSLGEYLTRTQTLMDRIEGNYDVIVPSAPLQPLHSRRVDLRGTGMKPPAPNPIILSDPD